MRQSKKTQELAKVVGSLYDIGKHIPLAKVRPAKEVTVVDYYALCCRKDSYNRLQHRAADLKILGKRCWTRNGWEYPENKPSYSEIFGGPAVPLPLYSNDCDVGNIMGATTRLLVAGEILKSNHI